MSIRVFQMWSAGKIEQPAIMGESPEAADAAAGGRAAGADIPSIETDAAVSVPTMPASTVACMSGSGRHAEITIGVKQMNRIDLLCNSLTEIYTPDDGTFNRPASFCLWCNDTANSFTRKEEM